MRDLQDDKRWLSQKLSTVNINDVDRIAEHALDRAISAEKERDELQKRVGELKSFMRLIVNTTAHPIPETYSLSGHLNAVEYAKHMLKETHNEAPK